MTQPGKRILLHTAAPWCQTGYGSQCAQLALRLKAAGHEVVISATYGLEGNSLQWNGIPIFPSDERWGNMRLVDYAGRHEADLVITLVDVHILRDERIRKLNLASWTPVDHQPTPPNVAEFFRQTGARPIAMSRFGEKMLTDDGFDPLYVPHGIDTNVFYPHDWAEAREMLGFADGQFVVGMVAGNYGHTPSRKAFPQALLAFAQFHRNHDDAILYLHTELTGQRSPAGNPGVNIPDLLQRYGIPSTAVKFTDQVTMDTGIPESVMASLYSAINVLLNPSYGEGFGIPIVESQACGTPVVATNWTSMPELVGAGWLVNGEPWDDMQHRSFYMCPAVDDILAALEDAYAKRDDETLAPRAVEFARQYDADKVFAEHWLPALEILGRPREVPPLPSLNRAQRRKAIKEALA